MIESPMYSDDEMLVLVKVISSSDDYVSRSIARHLIRMTFRCLEAVDAPLDVARSGHLRIRTLFQVEDGERLRDVRQFRLGVELLLGARLALGISGSGLEGLL
jgi:hypothetical protein